MSRRFKQVDENWLSQAIWNNAFWCDTVCRAFSVPGEFHLGYWICRGAAPPFYPNVITLIREVDTEQLTRLISLLSTKLPSGWGIKDSYANLRLTDFGFQVLFEAEWIYLPVSAAIPSQSTPELHWVIVKDEAALTQWEQAWRGPPPAGAEGVHETIFRPNLLTDDRLAILAAYRDKQIVAGAVGLHTKQVIGVSNIFVPGKDKTTYRAGLVARLRDIYPDMALVGYEGGADLEEMSAIGFQRIGPLRIWTKEGTGED